MNNGTKTLAAAPSRLLLAVALLALSLPGNGAAMDLLFPTPESALAPPGTAGEGTSFTTTVGLGMGEHLSLGGHGTFGASAKDRRSALYGLRGTWGRPLGPSLAVLLRLDAWSQQRGRSGSIGRAGVLPLLLWTRGSLRLRAGGGLARDYCLARWTPSAEMVVSGDVTLGSVTLEAGGQSRRIQREKTIPGRRSMGPDSIVIEEPGTVQTSRVAYQDVYLRLGWSHGGLATSAKLGRRLGREAGGPRSFGGFETALALTSRVALAAGYAYEPSVPELNLPAQRVSRAGLTLHLDAGPPSAGRFDHPPETSPALRLEPLGQGRYRLHIQTQASTRVELSGDFCDWTPLPMSREGGGWWTAECALRPGVHRISLRIDGGRWTAPPGLSACSDGFEGEAGILVISS
jgi:hypothetical protein